ncbi:DUF1534 domain-containing protein [Pseudomonas syringae]|nr:DUF1534 domain-containing protein [Pseudomonas syringae]
MRLSFPALQRGNAVGGALRHRSAPHHTLKIGRRASGTAWRRGASHDSCGLPGTSRSARSSVGMPVVTLRVTHLRCTTDSRSDAQRRTIVEVIVPHAPAWERLS